MARRRVLRSFADLVGEGENPGGMTGQTADATVHPDTGAGPQDWKWNQRADGERWNGQDPYAVEVAATPRKRR